MHPFAPLGDAIELHVMPSKRKTWEEHTKSGCYLGTSWDHCRCHLVWVKDTRITRVGQTVFFRHKYITRPVITQSDAIWRATDNLINALRGKQVVKGGTRSAIDLLVDVLQGYDGEPIKIENDSFS